LEDNMLDRGLDPCFRVVNNHERYHESLGNVTPADIYTGRDTRILEAKRRIKERTIKQRKQDYRKTFAIRQTMS